MTLHSFRQDLQDYQDFLCLVSLYPVHPVDPVRKWKFLCRQVFYSIKLAAEAANGGAEPSEGGQALRRRTSIEPAQFRSIFFSTSSAISIVLTASSFPRSFIPSSIMVRQKGQPTATFETC